MCEIITPSLTLFDDTNTIDRAGNETLINFLIDSGVNGILVLGSSGEFTTLNLEEKLSIFDLYTTVNNHRVDLFAGTNCAKIEETIHLSNTVLAQGFKGVMIICPYYYGISQREVYNYYAYLAQHISGDLYIYNYPDRSGFNISPQTVYELAISHPNIKGLKDSVSDPLHTNGIARAVASLDFKLYSGFDDQFLYNIATGGSGCIGALSNIVPDIWADLIHAMENSQMKKVLFLSHLIHQLMPLYTLSPNFIPLFKKLLTTRGLAISDASIFPNNALEPSTFETAKRILDTVLHTYHAYNNTL
ncbi:dihydrodipicolinate synthase family protein [Peptoniphilus equinus]|uniref:Dihydrodipicolinate synthase family protein n=1 Tax=Peptoniphilus equinus TaxID=3016343 RepID=A0ABY7QUU6_9FIRM|nr:dihydrodipicolinate synthase family protein [Peptoniphilus equinus]WBW49859.1 dihydrodipicolinate synthase family protein [Peptoniphilus equinus]